MICRLNWIHLVVTLLVLANAADDDDVLDLSDNDVSSFKAKVGQHDVMLVEFFAPWCGHCKRLAPEYMKAATLLKSNDPPVPLAKVDCTSDAGGKDVCSEFGVSGYPTLKIFRGESHQEYNGPREADGIVKYMRSQVGPASKSFDSFEALNEHLKKAKEVVVVGIFPNDKDPLAKKFVKAADKLRESVAFAHIHADSASGSVGDLAFYKKKVSSPSVLLTRPSTLHNKFESIHAQFDDDSLGLDLWVNKNYHGLVGHRTQSNMQDFKAPQIISYYDVDYVKNPKGTNYWRNRILKVAQNNVDKVTFAVSNSNNFAGELEEFGLEPQKDSRDATPLVAAKDKDGKKYVMREKFTVEAFEKFVSDFVEGNLEAHVKSEEVPDNSNVDVKVAVGKNFDELVMKSTKDILIEFYAPWCGHCKKLAPVFEELGKELANEDGVEIVKMDATANDVPSPFTVHGFPTIYFLPSDTKEPKKYDGGRELNDFIGFLAKHSSKEFVGFTRDGKKKDAKVEL